MSEISNYLRLMINGDKEAVITAVKADATPTEFTSQLTEGYKRKHLNIFNNSASASGECYYSYAALGDGHPVPKGEEVNVRVSADIDIFLFSDTGELGDLRVEEIS